MPKNDCLVSVNRVSGRGGLMVADSGDAAVAFGILNWIGEKMLLQTQLCHQNHFFNSIVKMEQKFLKFNNILYKIKLDVLSY